MGQYMVAAVVLNRVESSKYPDDVCEVVFQKAQFSFTTLKSLKMKEKDAAAVAEFIARDMLTSYEPKTDTLWYYNPKKANPPWAKRLVEDTVIGNHRFMRRAEDV